MQIRDKRLTHLFDGRVTLFDSVGIGEPGGESVPPHYQATRTMSACWCCRCRGANGARA